MNHPGYGRARSEAVTVVSDGRTLRSDPPRAGDEALVLQLMAVVMPFMFTVCMLALGSAALNCKGYFAYPAFSPILLNVFLIAAVAVVHWVLPSGDRAGLFLLAATVVVAGASVSTRAS